MLELKNVCFSYGDNRVLQNFNLSVLDGQCVCLSGASGCGKTTVLRLIAGLEQASSGTVTVQGKVSVVFQEDRLLWWYSLFENLKKAVDEFDEDKAMKLLDEVGLAEVKRKKISSLSGGMKRRAAIVRAILFGGDVLLLDEPFNGIDSDNKKKIADIIKREYLQKGKIVLMVSHIIEDAELLGAEIIKM